jgi:hypothetical protein
MKELALKVIRNGAVRKAVVVLVLAIGAALGFNVAGCTPSQVQVAKDARAVTDCVNGVLKDVPLDDLEGLSVEDGLAFAARVEACSKVRAAE